MLYLDDNYIGCEGAVAIAKALKKNTTLQTLYLDDDYIGCEGAMAIAKALETNTTLQKLSLHGHDDIGSELYTAMIAKALERNRRLQSS